MATNELRRGRRDLLKVVLEAVERLDASALARGAKVASLPAQSDQAVSQKTLKSALDDYRSEHAHLWDEKYTKQISAFMSVLLEFFGDE